MAGFADELSVKLTAKDEMSAKLREANKALADLNRERQKAQKVFDSTGSPEAARDVKRLGDEFDRLAEKQREAAKASKIANDALRKTRSEADRATTAVGRFGQTITKHSTAIRNAGLVAGAAMLLLAKQSIQAFAEAEKQQVMLTQAYGRFPKIQDVTRQSFDALNTSIMNLTGTDDDALASAEALLARFDLTGKQIQELMPLVTDYAIATGQDLPSAASTMGKAMLGNAKALKSMGINFKASGDRAADYSAIMAILERQVGGVGVAFGQTTAGQLAIANQNFENLKETIGASLVPALQTMVTVMKPIVGYLTALPQPLQQVGFAVTAVGVAAMIATPRLIAFNTSLKTIGLGIGPGVAVPVVAVLAAVVTSIKGVGDVANTSTGPVDGFLSAIKSFAPPMLVPSIFAVGTAINWVTNSTEDATQAVEQSDDAYRRAALSAQQAIAPTNEFAGSLGHVALQATASERALTRVASAMDAVDAAMARRKARRDYNTALDTFNKTPTSENAENAIGAANALARTFKKPKQQMDSLRQTYPQLKRAITGAKIPDAMQTALIRPLDRALSKIALVRAQLAGLAGAIARTGDTPVYKRAAGGPVFGPGTGTSDSIPVMVSNGEYVIRAAAARALGYDTLGRLNVADRTPTLPSIVNAPRITLPASTVGRDGPLVGTLHVYPQTQMDLDLTLARVARQQERDRKARTAGTR